MTRILSGRIAQLNGRVTIWLARIAGVALALIAFITLCDVFARRVFSSGILRRQRGA